MYSLLIAFTLPFSRIELLAPLFFQLIRLYYHLVLVLHYPYLYNNLDVFFRIVTPLSFRYYYHLHFSTGLILSDIFCQLLDIPDFLSVSNSLQHSFFTSLSALSNGVSQQQQAVVLISGCLS